MTRTAMLEGRNPLYNFRMPILRAVPLALVMTTLVAAQQAISFSTEDGGRVCADLYGQGTRAVVLAHGGRFNKESWRDQARALVERFLNNVSISRARSLRTLHPVSPACTST
jgi:hypothetical protein